MCGNTETPGLAPDLRKGSPHWPGFTSISAIAIAFQPIDEGIDLPNLEAAVDVAIRSASELVDETIKHDGGAIPDAMIVTDENGKTLATISILDVLRKRRDG